MTSAVATLRKGSIDTLGVEAVREAIDVADAAYYGSESLISDEVYDLLKRRLRALSPHDERLTRVGAKPHSFRSKVTHAVPMGSLDNTDNGIDGLDKWYNGLVKVVGPFDVMASLKVDGSSICATYRGGELVCVATRGDGLVGDDVTANGRRFVNLPRRLQQNLDIHVRGEAILYKADFRRLVEASGGAITSNPRNVGNGIIGREDGTNAEYIRFLAFGLSGVMYHDECEKFAKLKALGFDVVEHRYCANLDILRDHFRRWADSRDDLPYEIDGVVVVANPVDVQNRFITADVKTKLRPKYAAAIKFAARSNVTRVMGVTITVGHTGAIIPTAQLETVRIGGVNVSNVLLNNWDEIKSLDVAIGDLVAVELSGDIIPKVIGVVERPVGRTLIAEPTACPVCGSEAAREDDSAAVYCSNASCSAIRLGKIHNWITKVNILGIGDAIVKALWDNKLVETPSDLYALDADELAELELETGVRVGKSRAKTIINNINAKRELPLALFLGSLGIEFLGRRRAQILIQAAGGQLDTLDAWLGATGMALLESLPGVGATMFLGISAGLDECRPLIERLLANGISVQPIGGEKMAVAEKKVDLSAYSFCFTGTRECVDEVTACGGVVKSGISKGLNYLVQKHSDSSSAKTVKAESYGVKIIGIDFLKRVLAGEAQLP